VYQGHDFETAAAFQQLARSEQERVRELQVERAELEERSNQTIAEQLAKITGLRQELLDARRSAAQSKERSIECAGQAARYRRRLVTARAAMEKLLPLIDQLKVAVREGSDLDVENATHYLVRESSDARRLLKESLD
jgi:hypothetical protein